MVLRVKQAVVVLATVLCGCTQEPRAVTAVEPRASASGPSTAGEPVASAPSTTVSPAVPAVVAVADELVDGVAARITKRCLLARRGQVRFFEGGDVVSGDGRGEQLAAAMTLPVLEERPAGLRVLVENEGVLRLLVFVERADLQRVLTTETVLALAPGAPAGDEAGVRVAAGLPVEEKARRGDERKVAGSSGEVAFEGWVPAGAIGEVFEPRALGKDSRGGLVREGATVVAAPGGAVIARFLKLGLQGAFIHEVEPEPGAAAGFQRVRYATPHVEIRGLVKAADFKLRTPDDASFGGSVGEGAGVGARSTRPLIGKLETGAPLFAPGHASRVGVALSPLPVFGSGSPDGEGLLDIEFSARPFHAIRARARVADIR